MLLAAAFLVSLAVVWTVWADSREANGELRSVGHLAVLSDQQRELQSALLAEAAGVSAYIRGDSALLRNARSARGTLASGISTPDLAEYPEINSRVRAAAVTEVQIAGVLSAQMAAVRAGNQQRALALLATQHALFAAYVVRERAVRQAMIEPLIEAEERAQWVTERTRMVGVIGAASLALTTYLIILTLIDGWWVESLAECDTLTGLAHRRVFEAKLRQMLARVAHGGPAFGVIYIDVDKFKSINDVHGHAVGDQVLSEIGKRLGGAVRGGDVAARLGGDEFALLIAGVKNSEQCRAVAGRIARALDNPITLADRALPTRCSIGFSACPEDGTTMQALLDSADQRMYSEKEGRREVRAEAAS
jgi:diguanylate cyclase (GGDEF)-like protein